MKRFSFLLLLLSVFSCTQAQPSHTTIQADIKQQMGANCTLVTVTGTGKTVKEYDNGAWVNYFRVPVNAVLKTDMQGVTRLMKGAAVYSVNGGRYHFVKYNTGTGEYIGLQQPAASEIVKLINTLPDMAMGGLANIVTEVENISIDESSATWHTLLSVSVKCTYTYWYKTSNTTLQKVKAPFDIRLYRKTENSAWHQASLIKPNAASDSRKEQLQETKNNQHAQSILEQSMQRKAALYLQSLPDVQLQAFNNAADAAEQLNRLLYEGDAGKAEKALLLWIHPSQKNSAGMLNGYAESLLSKLKQAASNDFSSYKDQYCQQLNIKEKNTQSIEWWNKDKTKFSRLSVQQQNGSWYITDASINLWQSFNAVNAQKTGSSTCL